MGCLESKKAEKVEEEEPKVYSWQVAVQWKHVHFEAKSWVFVFVFVSRDRKDRPNPKDFTIADLKGETSGRLPGKIGGQQFIIRDCQVGEVGLKTSFDGQLDKFWNY